MEQQSNESGSHRYGDFFEKGIFIGIMIECDSPDTVSKMCALWDDQPNCDDQFVRLWRPYRRAQTPWTT